MLNINNTNNKNLINHSMGNKILWAIGKCFNARSVDLINKFLINL